ncbi:MAG: DUF6537 domain-containing protein [Burkholderiaceae bacterium]
MVDAVGAGAELARRIEVRAAELIAYQGRALARHYLRRVAEVRRVESALVGDRTELSAAVARNLYKLMAVKDEYEVARLLLDPAERARIEGLFGAGARVTWHLHPTILRRLGLPRKARLGPWFRPVLQILRAARRLRGSPLDLFARTGIRATERALLGHYERLIDAVLSSLEASRYRQATALLDAPDEIRGYDEVKQRSISAYLLSVRAQARALGIEPAQGCALFDELPQDTELRRQTA